MLHTRINHFVAAPAALDECLTYIEREIRRELESRSGSLGIWVLADRERGVVIFGSVWATGAQMSGSEDAEVPLRGELAKRAAGPLRRWGDEADTIAKRADVWSPRQLQAGFAYLVRKAARDCP